MNIAVISNQETHTGLSSFCIMLATIYSMTQHKNAAVIPTSEAKDMFGLIGIEDFQPAKAPATLGSMIGTSMLDERDIWDYGYRIGNTHAYLFDTFIKDATDKQKYAMTITIAEKLKASMCLLEIEGDINERTNKQILAGADEILYVFNHSKKSINKAVEYINETRGVSKTPTLYICQQFDRNTLSEKELGSKLGISAKNISQVPYNSVVNRFCLNSELQRAADLVYDGHYEFTEFRPKFYEIMSTIYNRPGLRSQIKGVSEWCK